MFGDVWSAQLVVIADLACAGAEDFFDAGWRHTPAKEEPGESVCSTCLSGQAASLLKQTTTLTQSVCLQPCNPFGGAESCMTLSADSKFGQVCSGHDLKVLTPVLS